LQVHFQKLQLEHVKNKELQNSLRTTGKDHFHFLQNSATKLKYQVMNKSTGAGKIPNRPQNPKCLFPNILTGKSQKFSTGYYKLF